MADDSEEAMRPDELQSLRSNILSNWDNLQGAVSEKKKYLLQQLKFHKLIKEVDELVIWITDKLQIAQDQCYKDTSNLKGKKKSHIELLDEMNLKQDSVDSCRVGGEEYVSEELMNHPIVRNKLDTLLEMWQLLTAAMEARGRLIEEALKYVTFMRDVRDISRWVDENDRYCQATEVGDDLEQNEALREQFAKFMTQLKDTQGRLDFINEYSIQLVTDKHKDLEEINSQTETINKRFGTIQELCESRERYLEVAHTMHKYYFDVNTATSWIQAKEVLLANEDYGKDMTSVSSLLNSHMDIERELNTLKEKVASLGEIAEELGLSHPERKEEVDSKYASLSELWVRICEASALRRTKLDESFLYHKFLVHYRDLAMEVERLQGLCAHKKVPRDVTEAAEFVLDHNQLKVQLQCWEDSYSDLQESGKDIAGALIEESLVKEKIDELQERWEDVNVKWEDLMKTLIAHKLYQAWMRNSEVILAWLASREQLVSSAYIGTSLDEVEAQLKKLDDFKQSLRAQENKIASLENDGKEMTDADHFASSEIQEKTSDIVARVGRISQKLQVRVDQLKSGVQYHHFLLESDELGGWVEERLTVCLDQDYLDFTNLQGKVQKHEIFEGELESNHDRVEYIEKVGGIMLESEHYASPEIKAILERIAGSWGSLMETCLHKKQKLLEAYNEMLYNRGVSDLQNWLQEIEVELSNEDYGTDLATVKSLSKSHSVLETVLQAQRSKLEALGLQAAKYIEEDHFDSSKIRDKQTDIEDRFTALEEPMRLRKERLSDALLLQQFFRDVDDEITWVKEKEPGVKTEATGTDLYSARNLVHSHDLLMSEVNIHGGKILDVCERGEHMIENKHFALLDIQDRIDLLRKKWQNLHALAAARKADLEDAIHIHQFFTNAQEIEAWCKEMEPLFSNPDYGKDEDTSKGMLRRNQALTAELQTHATKVKELMDEGNRCKQRNITLGNGKKKLKVAVIHDYSGKTNREITATKGTEMILLQSNNKDWWKVEINGKIGFYPANFLKTLPPEDEKPATVAVPEKMGEVKRGYEELAEAAEHRRQQLDETVTYHTLMAEIGDLESWITEQERMVTQSNTATELPFLVHQLTKFAEFERELGGMETLLSATNERAVDVIDKGHSKEVDIQSSVDNLNRRYDNLVRLSARRKAQLTDKKDLLTLYKGVDECIDWIEEKKKPLLAAETSGDIELVKTMQRKHVGMARELNSIKDQVGLLNEEGDRISTAQPDKEPDVRRKLCELEEHWGQVEEANEVHSDWLAKCGEIAVFKKNHQDLVEKLDTLITEVDGSTAEKGTDVGSVEALIASHRELKEAIEEEREEVEKCTLTARQLAEPGEGDIQEDVTVMEEKLEQLEKQWQDKENDLQNQLELKACDLDEDVIEARLATMSERMSTMTETDCGKIEQLLALEEERMNNVEAVKERVSSSQADLLNATSSAVADKIAELKKLQETRKKELQDKTSVDQFLCDADEIVEWLEERLAQCNVQPTDLTNLQAEMQDHQSFETEIGASQERVQAVVGEGNSLLQDERCSDRDDKVMVKVNEIGDKWEELCIQTEKKLCVLKDIRTLHQFNCLVQDMAMWLGMIETQLSMEVNMKDMANLQNLIKKNQMLGHDIQSHDRHLMDVNVIAGEMLGNDHFDSDNISRKQEQINGRFDHVKVLQDDRTFQLNHCQQINNVIREINEREVWVDDRRRFLQLTTSPRDLLSTDTLKKKLTRLEAEIMMYEESITQTSVLSEKCRAGHDVNPTLIKEMSGLLDNLLNKWSEVKGACESRHDSVDHAHAFFSWLLDVGEEEAWIGEQLKSLTLTGTRDSLAAVNRLLKKYGLFERELETHNQHIDTEILARGQAITDAKAPHGPEVERHSKRLKENIGELYNICAAHKACLTDEAAHLNFNWKAEAIETFMTQKERFMVTEDVGADLTSCEVLMSRHANYTTSLSSFKENIDALTSLKDKLIASQHAQSKALKQRQTEVVRRWDALTAECEARRKKLTVAHAHFLDIERIFQAFAEKASQFNGWWENAEEDLTDPIHTRNLQECKSLREEHTRFVELMSSEKREQYKKLTDIDRVIRSYHVTVNPYTWFTMDALEECWKSLLRNVKDRELMIEKETLRQEHNEELRKAYALQANKFGEWLDQTKQQLTTNKYRLEEQRELIDRKHEEIKKRRGLLRDIEELGAHLEQGFVFDNKFTTHSTVTLAQQWDQLNEFTRRMHHTVAGQIEAQNMTGVDEDELKEFTLMFKHFDKDRSGRLDHVEFKACLRALGFDLPVPPEGEPDTVFEAILDCVDFDRDGLVRLEEYMQFMISRTTDNVAGNDQLTEAFQSLTEGGQKPFITASELYAAMPPEQAKYCIDRMEKFPDVPGALDYTNFTKTIFKSQLNSSIISNS